METIDEELLRLKELNPEIFAQAVRIVMAEELEGIEYEQLRQKAVSCRFSVPRRISGPGPQGANPCLLFISKN